MGAKYELDGDKLTKKNSSTAIATVRGNKIFAKQIVSSVGIRNTFKKLITNNKISEKYDNLIKNVPPSVSFVYLFVNLKGSPEELKLRSSNIWVWPHKDYEKLLKDFEENPIENPIPLFIACSCAKDPTWNKRYPGKSNAIILTTANKEYFEKWENERCMHRGEEYNNLKDLYAQRMLNEGLFKFYPQLKDKVEYYTVGTPLTNQFYLGAYAGEAYGLDSTTYRYTEQDLLKPYTDIENLYLTGQDICTLGFTGALMAGVLTANSILGYGTITDIIKGRNIVSDLMWYKFCSSIETNNISL